jgi:hypothetical protein
VSLLTSWISLSLGPYTKSQTRAPWG